MNQNTFGHILKNARERQNIDINEVSRRLRIRVDILQAIEHSDFSRMPARGYTRNMVSAYARLLGLNAPVISRQYLRESNKYQMSLRHNSANYPDNTGNTNYSRHTNTNEEKRGRSITSQRQSQGQSQRGFFSDFREQSTNRDFANTHNRRAANSTRQHSSRYSINRNGNSNNYYQPQVQSARNIGKQRGFSLFQGKIPLIFGVIVVSILLLIIGTQIISCVSPKKATTNTTVPISGVTDTTGSTQNTSNTNSNTNTTSEAAPAFCMVKYTITEGKSVWIEIYQNNSDSAEEAKIATAEDSKEYKVTGVWSIRNVPDNTALKLFVDNKEVELQKDETGNYSYTVNFTEILEKWKKDHPNSA